MLLRHTFLLLTISVAVASAQPVALNSNPSRVIGQDTLTINTVNPNLVEGREFYQPQGIAIDSSTNPPGLYVADTLNNRVLGFRNAASFTGGQKADIVLGQPDFVTTLPEGPGRNSNSFTMGFATPVGVAVDANGNVYVVDAGNNRIIRFPTPFNHTTQTADLVIGQPGFATSAANQGGLSASSLAFAINNQALSAGITFDASGNLWVADAANYRVLRFPASSLTSGASSAPAADLVLGQPNFSTAGPPSTDPTNLTGTDLPSSLVFDSAGHLFVMEAVNGLRGRVLVFNPPFTSSQPASRILGYDNSIVQAQISGTQFSQSPTGLFVTANDNLGVVDTQNNRILIFNPVSQWTTGLPFTQNAIAVIGQPDFNSGQPNKGKGDAAPDRLFVPSSAVAFGNELYVADAGNQRVIVLPAMGNTFGPATRVLGQLGMQYNAPNLVEGREVDFSTLTSQGVAGDAGVAIDTHSSPTHLYIADTYNNRVLVYADVRGIQNGAKATFALGQPDLLHTSINYPLGTTGTPTAGGLYQPVGIAVAPNGDVYVADRGNGRVVRYPSPFDHQGGLQLPDLVLGQQNFTTLSKTASATNLTAPTGVAIASDGTVVVSDILQNRVVAFPGPAANLTNGMAASTVYGQADFTSTGGGTADNQFSSPYEIAVDSSDRVYVADAGNNRVLIFDSPSKAGTNPHALTTIGNLNVPRDVYVNQATGDIWVADTGNDAVLRFPAFSALAAAGNMPSARFSSYSPRAATVDQLGNLYVADLANRVLIYYRSLGIANGANFLSTSYGPGTFLSIFGSNGQFASSAQSFSTVPVPTDLNNVQVLINGKPAPVYYVQGNQINFLLPMSTPTTGFADVQVVRLDTGEILGGTSIPLNVASPGLFTLNASGSGQVAALNQDNTVNGPNNPAAVGSVIQMFGTGQGFVPGAPPDGTPPSGPVPTPTKPTVIMYTSQVPPANIQYSGLAPGLVGIWQINIAIPLSAIPAGQNSGSVDVVLTQDNIPSGGPVVGRRTTIWVKK